MARREALAAVGGFDERFFLYEEDVDLCLRLRRAGWRVLYTPRAEVVHHLGKSMAQAPVRARLEYHRSHLLYYRKHRGRLLTALLAFSLALRGAAGWFAALGPGPSRRERRREASLLFRIAFGER
jgi:GT2 family glycosyltransferase